MYDPVVFDLDGTLTDSKTGIINGIQYALEKEDLPRFDEAKIVEYIGGPLRQVVCDHYGMSDQAAGRLIARYRDYYRRIGLFENRLFPGVRELLESLRAEGRRLAIATAKPTGSARFVLDLFRISHAFSVVSGSERAAGRDTKTAILEHALEQLGDNVANRPVMIGDRRYDIEAARAAGIDSIGLAHGYGSVEELAGAGATRVADTIDTLGLMLATTASP